MIRPFMERMHADQPASPPGQWNRLEVALMRGAFEHQGQKCSAASRDPPTRWEYPYMRRP